MERLKTYLKGAFSYPRLLLKTHRITAISIIAASVLFAVYAFLEADYDWSKMHETGLEIFFHLCLAVVFFAVFALCLESIRPKWSTAVKTAVFSLFGLLSLFMSYITADYYDDSHATFFIKLADYRDRTGPVSILLYIGGLMVLALLLAVYFSYSHDIHQRFNDHVMNAGSNIFFTSIIYGVIQLGVIFLTVIVSILLYDDAFNYLAPVLILINGLFFAPAVICALIRENEKANLFMQILVRYVMLTIAFLAFVIIYIYILKLVVTRDVPSNSVYAILTALFVISMFIAYMSTTFEEKGLLQKFAYNAPLVFAPFIFMQCYTMIVRINQYGLTPKRYFGIAFILFEAAYIIYYTVMHRRDHEVAGRNVLLIICVFVVATIFAPGISGRSLSLNLARRTLDSYLDKAASGATISDREYVRANAAYGFLRDNDFGKGRIERYFTAIDDDTIEKLHSGAKTASLALADRDADEPGSSSKSSWFNADLSELTDDGAVDINGFDSLMFVHVGNDSETSEGKVPVDTSRLNIYQRDTDSDINPQPLMSVDLKDYVRGYIKIAGEYDDNIIEYREFQRAVCSMSVIDINENARLLITHADISRNAANEPVYVYIDGYLLTKK